METLRDEMLRNGDARRRYVRDAKKVHYMRMRPHEVQAICVMGTRSSTEGVSELLA